jgi:hypothetical protein
MTTHLIDIDLNKKCVRCGKGGATQSGYCLECINKNLNEGKYDHLLTKAEKETVTDYARGVVDHVHKIMEGKPMEKIGDKIIRTIIDTIASFLTEKKPEINEAYLKAAGDKLAIGIGISLSPAKRANEINVKVGISFVKDRLKDEIEFVLDENQLSLYDGMTEIKPE